MLKKLCTGSLMMALTIVGSATADAADVSIKVIFGAPHESIKMNFEDGSKHFVMMIRREGSAEGSGPLAGAAVTEYGWHDINPPKGADPHGYLQFKAANGDIANIKWAVRAVFFKGEEKPKLANSGFWKLVSGTGQFKGMTGVGTLTIKFPSKTDRIYILDGELNPLP